MINKSVIQKVGVVFLSVVMICSFTACKKSSKKPTTSSSSSESEVTTTTTAAPTTSLTVYSGPLPSNDVTQSWQESALSQETTMYATVSAGNFLRIRKGPGTDYDIAGTLTRGQTVTVVAQTGNGWYKTTDGFYVSGNYLSNTMPA